MALRRRARTLAFVAIVAATAALLAPQLASAHGRVPAAGSATWVQVSSGAGIGNIVDPDVQRFGSRLQVVWTQGSGTNQVLRTRLLAATGAAASTVRNVLPPWASLDEYPAVIGSNGQRVIVFAGVQDTNTSNPYSAGYDYYATSTDGLSWTLGNGTVSSSTSAYASYGSDAVDAAGTPISVFTAGTANDISFHVGLDSLPPTHADGSTKHNPSCCAYYAGAGYDAKAGQAWTAWYSNSGKAATDGIDAQQIYPSAGTLVHAPQSTSSYAGSISSVAPIQRVQVAARAGGGLFTAYGIGYPSQTKLALWRLGSSAPIIVNAHHEVAQIGVASGPAGRIWLFWWLKGTSTLHAVRTNAAATRLGRICSARTPRATTEVWKTAGDGSLGPLDLVVNAGDGSNEQLSATQVKPCLSARISPSSVKSSTGGSVTIHVSDAGSAVKGAKVSYAGTSKTTDVHGNATFHVAKGTAKGRHAITFGHAGYTGGKVRFRVT